MRRRVLKVLENVSVTGPSSTFKWPGGKGLLVVSGTLGGTTVKLRVTTESGGFMDGVDPIETSIVGFLLFELPKITFRIWLVGGSPSGVDVTAHPFPTERDM